jgi:hypothetical protein
MKGSTVDRNVIIEEDKVIIKKGEIDKIIEKYKKEVLKDMDFIDLGLTFKLSKKDSLTLQSFTKYDAEMLKEFNLTDYSLLVSIHKYTKEDFEKSYKNCRVMKSYDSKYLFNFSIIDFLCVNIYIYLLGI